MSVSAIQHQSTIGIHLKKVLDRGVDGLRDPARMLRGPGTSKSRIPIPSVSHNGMEKKQCP